MTTKDKFIQLYRKDISRQGSEDLLAYLERSDFFRAPASTRYHLSEPGGLCQHSVNVYERLRREFGEEFRAGGNGFNKRCFGEDYNVEDMNESIAIAALLHDLCKVNFYSPTKKNVKNKETGRWQEVQTYEIRELFPYGHGEKSVFIIQNYMKLTPAEATAIRWHMGGFDSAVKGGERSSGDAWTKYPLGVMLHVADLKATYLDDDLGVMEYGD